MRVLVFLLVIVGSLFAQAKTALNYYEIIGISASASPAEARSAYLARAKAFHPDLNPNDPLAIQKFQLLGNAWDTIKDPLKRAAYDRWLRSRSAGQPAAAAKPSAQPVKPAAKPAAQAEKPAPSQAQPQPQARPQPQRPDPMPSAPDASVLAEQLISLVTEQIRTSGEIRWESREFQILLEHVDRLFGTQKPEVLYQALVIAIQKSSVAGTVADLSVYYWVKRGAELNGGAVEKLIFQLGEWQRERVEHLRELRGSLIPEVFAYASESVTAEVDRFERLRVRVAASRAEALKPAQAGFFTRFTKSCRVVNGN